jgi:hypothetical protein
MPFKRLPNDGEARDQQDRSHTRLLEQRKQLRRVRSEDSAYRRHCGRAEEPEQDPGEKPDVRSECQFDIRIRTAGERHSTPGLGEAQDDEAHRHGAHDVCKWCRRSERVRHNRGKAKDAPAYRDVDDAGGKGPRADGAHERTLGDR